MKKISQRDAIKTTTMFLRDEAIEQEFDKKVCDGVESYCKAMVGIDTEEGLENFIRENKNSIDMLETVLGISGERMKRVVTMLRVEKGYTFDTEWSEARLQQELVKKPELMKEYCTLFLRGKQLEKYKNAIPKFILDDFCINQETMVRLNPAIMVKLFKRSNDTLWTSRYSAFYEKRIMEGIEANIVPLGFFLQVGDLNGIGVNLHYISNGSKHIIVTYNYSLTTSGGQTKYYNRIISPIYKAIRKCDHVILVNFLDGAGWVGRSADFKKVYNDCTYFLNLKNVDGIKTIVKTFFNL